jgi:hypothetical protein
VVVTVAAGGLATADAFETAVVLPPEVCAVTSALKCPTRRILK